MKQLLFIVSLICVCNSITAQLVYQRAYGGPDIEVGNVIAQTSDGGYIIAGATTTLGFTDTDFYIVKTDAFGDTLWTRIFSGPDIDHPTSIKQTSDGGYIIGGYTFSFLIGGGVDACLIKTDSSGNIVWSKNVGSGFIEQCREVQQTADGGYVLFGMSQQIVGIIDNMYIVKTDSAGNVLWSKNYGSSGSEYGWTGTTTSDGGFIIAGQTGSFTPNVKCIYVIKTNAVGDTLWSKIYYDTYEQNCMSIMQTSDGGYILGGDKYYTNVKSFCMIKTDTVGNIQWSKTYFTGATSDGNVVRQTSDGGYILGGMSYASAFIIKTDSAGDTLWTKAFGAAPGQAECFGLSQTTDGGYIVTGQRYNGPANDYDIYLVKMDSMGNYGCNDIYINTTVLPDTYQVVTPHTEVNSLSDQSVIVPTISGNYGSMTIICNEVGLQETAGNTFEISPGISSGDFRITLSNNVARGSVQVISVLGKVVFSENIFDEVIKEVHLYNLAKGIYIVRIFDGQSSVCRKIEIE